MGRGKRTAAIVSVSKRKQRLQRAVDPPTIGRRRETAVELKKCKEATQRTDEEPNGKQSAQRSTEQTRLEASPRSISSITTAGSPHSASTCFSFRQSQLKEHKQPLFLPAEGSPVSAGPASPLLHLQWPSDVPPQPYAADYFHYLSPLLQNATVSVLSPPPSSSRRFTWTDCTADERLLRRFDLESVYGGSSGISRADRWMRAHCLGLSPPREVWETLHRLHKDFQRDRSRDCNDCPERANRRRVSCGSERREAVVPHEESTEPTKPSLASSNSVNMCIHDKRLAQRFGWRSICFGRRD